MKGEGFLLEAAGILPFIIVKISEKVSGCDFIYSSCGKL